MSTDNAEYQKLYKLLASLSSKTASQSNHIITPMISLAEGKTSRTLTLDIPLDTPVRSPTPPLQIEKPTPLAAALPEAIQIVAEDPVPKKPIICDACHRVFPTLSNLQTHNKITPMCAQWFTLPNKEDYVFLSSSIHMYMDELLAETVAAEGSVSTCRFCHITFSNKGNLHKHFHTSIVCNRMAYARFKKIAANLK
jgi:uncharacterized CHY-type Zn-finger protein